MSKFEGIKQTGCWHEQPVRMPATRKEIVQRIVKYLKKRKKDFDGIAISGYSMSMVGSVVAYLMDRPLCVVAKPDDKRNTYLSVEGLHSQRWLMIDDLVSSGATLQRVYQGVETIQGSLVGVVLWKSERNYKTVYFTKKTELGLVKTEVPLWLSFDIDQSTEDLEEQ